MYNVGFVFFGVMQTLLDLYAFVLLFRALAPWFGLSPYHPIFQVIYRLTEPVLAPIRRILPQGGMFDFSIMVAMLGVVALGGLLTILKAAFIY